MSPSPSAPTASPPRSQPGARSIPDGLPSSDSAPPRVHVLRPSTRVLAPLRPGYERVLTAEALLFLADLAREFGGRVDELLALRRVRQSRWDSGLRPGFRPETAELRQSAWTVAPIPPDLADRRVEITGPVDRKTVINALNSGAQVFMADFEDATTPTWRNLVEGQLNLMDAVRRTIRFVAGEGGRTYELRPDPAVLFVRPRGWHLWEKHLVVDGRAISGALFDFGLYFFHNALALLERGSGPYFYLPKLQSSLEARLWNDVFAFAQDSLGLSRGTIRATVLVETLPAAFEMDEILWELRYHSAGLNCGRWDYIFSAIKTRRADGAFVLPDRAQVTMTQPFLRAYSRLAVRTCHRRGIHCIGGMAAFVPVKADAERNARALGQVRADKAREVGDGHDGTWVAHPALVPVAREVFDAQMREPNQIHRKIEDLRVTEEELLALPQGTITAAGLRNDLEVALCYLESWLRGVGCVAIHDLMEDAATAEIARTQVWQWIRRGAKLEDGTAVTAELVRSVLKEELAKARSEAAAGRWDEAAALLDSLCTDEHLHEFLTLPAYELLLDRGGIGES
jgi:malate synthase